MTEELMARYERILGKMLGEEDDLSFWRLVFEQLLTEIALLNPSHSKKHALYLQIGSCSHWCRPHQTRWLADKGSFAFPSGYGGGHSLGSSGLPEYDYFMLLRWDEEQQAWQFHHPYFYDKRKIVCRVALPTRTACHITAAVHTMWTPGTPEHPDTQREVVYGFRKVGDQWSFVKSLVREGNGRWETEL